MAMIIQGDDNMRAVRRGVFETNSSSTHSLTLIKTPYTSTTGKLKSGGTYEYKPMGEKWDSDEYTKSFHRQFDKLCICFDLLFYDYSSKAYKLGRILPSELEKFRKKPSDAEYLLARRYVLNEFKKGNYYREFQMVLKKHNIEFILNDLVVQGGGNKQRYPITCDNYGFDFDFMRAFAIPNGWQSVGEAIDNIVFNPNIELLYDFCGYA